MILEYLTSTLSALGGTGTTIDTVYDEEKDKINKLPAVAATTTTVTFATMPSAQERRYEKTREKYATIENAHSYVDSMTDEDLEQALIRLNLLEEEIEVKSDTKVL